MQSYKRFQPYSSNGNKPPNLRFWFESKQAVYPQTADQQSNDACVGSCRYLGLFSGVPGVGNIGMLPAAVPNEMAFNVGNELEKRLAGNAQRYDQEARDVLKSTVMPNNEGGWLRYGTHAHLNFNP